MNEHTWGADLTPMKGHMPIHVRTLGTTDRGGHKKSCNFEGVK